VVHLGWRRITGNPVKKGLQQHENFLIVPYRGARSQRLEQFRLSQDEDFFEVKDGEDEVSYVTRLHNAYLAYCKFWEEDSNDEPSKVVALFLKMQEAYLRSSGTIRKSHFWMGEAENVRWHPAYKLTGKDNYVTEGLYRNDLLYGPLTTDLMLEHMRVNRYFVMSEDGGAMSMDELNELVNLWIKGCHSTEDFSKICDRSRFLMVIRKCAFETFGVKKRHRGTSQKATQEEGIASALEFFRQAEIFVDSNRSREMTNDFFWAFVKVQKATGTEKDAARENVEETPETSALHQVLFDPQSVYTRHWDEEKNKDECADETVNEDDDERSVNTFNLRRRDGNAGVEDEGGPGNVEGWENMEEDESGNADEVNSAMRIGRMKRAPMSSNILKDALGVDGCLAFRDEAKRHEKKKLEKKRPFIMIKVACKHFNSGMHKKCKYLWEDIEASKEGTYNKMDYDWMKDFDEEMKDCS
jgi:hypothetical protein